MSDGRVRGLTLGERPDVIRKRKHGLSAEQLLVSACVGSSKNLKDPKEGPVDLKAQGGFVLDCDCSSHSRSCCNLASVGVAWSLYTVGGGCLVAMLVLIKVS